MFQAGSNPPGMILTFEDDIIGGQEDDTQVFSVVEVRPRISALDIFYETSTSGLVSELNAQIASGSSVTPITPITPPEPES